MNPKIAIAVDSKNKATATLTGMVTVGAKIDVEVRGIVASDIPDWNPGDKFYGKSMRFRVVDGDGRDLVRFPLVEKSGASATDGDKWTVSTVGTADVFANTGCPVEFDTDALRREMCGIPFNECREFGIILDSIVDDAQYAVGKLKVRQWAAASEEDPTVLPDWRETLGKLNTDLAAVEASKTAAANAASAAGVSSASAGASATSAGQYADAALGHKNDAVAAKNAAEVAASHYPYVDANGHWKVWESGAWVDKGAAKGDKGDTGDVSQVLVGRTLKKAPTQRQIAEALKTIWTELGGTLVD